MPDRRLNPRVMSQRSLQLLTRGLHWHPACRRFRAQPASADRLDPRISDREGEDKLCKEQTNIGTADSCGRNSIECIESPYEHP
jgi:hypothetical protein